MAGPKRGGNAVDSSNRGDNNSSVQFKWEPQVQFKSFNPQDDNAEEAPKQRLNRPDTQRRVE